MQPPRGTPKKKPRGRPFKPGQSGNPGGRPKGLTEFRIAARAHSDEALRRLVGLMRGRNPDPLASARLRAIREILDRAWGKPSQELYVQGAMAAVDVTNDSTPADRMEIARRLAYLLAETAQARSGEEEATPQPVIRLEGGSGGQP